MNRTGLTFGEYQKEFFKRSLPMFSLFIVIVIAIAIAIAIVTGELPIC
ncbi:MULTISPECIES: hypothetical protein [Pseudomonadaceae]|nr:MULTISPECIES: hypothetical protein [Pseudomonas]